MRAVVIALIVFAGGAFADEASDRAAVEKAVVALNSWPLDPALFTADFDGRDLLHRPSVAPSTGPVQCPEVWWETCGMVTIGGTPEDVFLPEAYRNPRIVPTKIRFITPDVAIADVLWKRPLLMVLKRQGTDWKIASLRELADK